MPRTALRVNFPVFEVSDGVDPANPFLGDLTAVQCTRCGEICFVFIGVWARGAYETRPCTYCWKASKIPEEVRRMETDPKQEFMEEASSEDRGFTEPEDDEHAEVTKEDADEAQDRKHGESDPA